MARLATRITKRIVEAAQLPQIAEVFPGGADGRDEGAGQGFVALLGQTDAVGFA